MNQNNSTSRFVRSGLNWQQFKSVQKTFADFPGVRLYYHAGSLEIVSVSSRHEAISRTINALLIIYLTKNNFEFSPSGACTQEYDERVSVQADESFFFGKSNSALIPDLSIQIIEDNINISRVLDRYKSLVTPEVWLWKDDLLQVYRLRDYRYNRVSKSEFEELKELNIPFLSDCINLSSHLEAIKNFEKVL